MLTLIWPLCQSLTLVTNVYTVYDMKPLHSITPLEPSLYLPDCVPLWCKWEPLAGSHFRKIVLMLYWLAILADNMFANHETPAPVLPKSISVRSSLWIQILEPHFFFSALLFQHFSLVSLRYSFQYVWELFSLANVQVPAIDDNGQLHNEAISAVVTNRARTLRKICFVAVFTLYARAVYAKTTQLAVTKSASLAIVPRESTKINRLWKFCREKHLLF